MAKTATAEEQLRVAEGNNQFGTFFSSLGFNFLIGITLFLLFCILRPLKPKIFSPRNLTLPKSRHLVQLPTSWFGWIPVLLRVKHEDILKKCGIDAYSNIRFLFVFMRLFAFLILIIPTLLLPVYMVDQKDLTGLSRVSVSNIKDKSRIWAQAVAAFLVSACVVGVLFYEYKQFFNIRKKYLLELGTQARTVLVTNLNYELANSDSLEKLFKSFPGGIEKITLCHDNSKLEKLAVKRQNLVQRLELLIMKSILSDFKKSEFGPQKVLMGPFNRSRQSMRFKSRIIQPDVTFTENSRADDNMRLSSMVKEPEEFLEENIDNFKSIRDLCDMVKEVNSDINVLLKDPELRPFKSACFVTFNTLLAARLAEQSVAHTSPILITSNIHPLDVVTGSLFIKIWEHKVRTLLFGAFIGTLIVFWAIPVTLVSSLASLDSLANLLPFLSFVLDLPKILIDFVQGVIPSLAICLLIQVLLKVLLVTTRWEGALRFTDIQLSIMDRHFVFLLFNVLFVVTLANGAIKSMQAIYDKPAYVFDILSESMPKVSNFFISFILFQALVGLMIDLFSSTSFITKSIFETGLSNITPRGFIKNNVTRTPIWGWVWPTHILMVTITLSYITLAPTVLFFSMFYFAVAYFVMLYKIACVFHIRPENETGGLFFIKALSHSFIGVYIFQVIVFSIMLLNGSIGPTLITVLTIVATAITQHYCNSRFLPSLKGLPVSSTIEDNDSNDKGLSSSRSSFLSKDLNLLTPFEIINHPIMTGHQPPEQFFPASEIPYHQSCAPAIPPIWLPDIFPMPSSHAQQLIKYLELQEIPVVIGYGVEMDLQSREIIVSLPS